MTPLEQLLILHEGLRTAPYRCKAGHWTWGVGRNLDARPLDLDEQLYLLTQGPGRESALWLLRRDLERLRPQVARDIPEAADLDPVRHAAVTDLAYNLGVAGLRRFVGFLRYLRKRRWLDAGWELYNSAWWYQVGPRGPRLRAMIETGDWPPEIDPDERSDP